MNAPSVKNFLVNTSQKSIFPPLIPKLLPKKLWIKSFSENLSLHLYTERYVNKGAYHSFRHYSEVSQAFRPIDGDRSFQLPYFLLPKTSVRVEISEPNVDMNKWFDWSSNVPFFVHPDMLETYESQGTQVFNKSKIAGWVTAVPTSSTRTIAVNLDGVVQMVKTDMSGKRLGRLTRQLTEKSVLRSQLIHELLNKIPKNELPSTFAYFPENVGVVFRDYIHNLGNIYRQYHITPVTNKGKWVIPFFSLYSTDLRNPGNELIIEQLVTLSGNDPLKFFEKKIARPYIYNAFYMAFRHGLLFEPHPQNVLVELDEDFRITRYVYRDLQTVIIDSDLRKQQGNKDNFPPEAKIIAKWQKGLDKKLEYSSFYDHRMAYQTLEEIILALAAKYPPPIAQWQEIVKKVFHEVVEEMKVNVNEFFPKNTYYIYRDGMMKGNVMEPVPFLNPPYR